MLEVLKQSQLILPIRKIIFEKKFSQHANVNYFRGVYSTFEEAMYAAPKTKPRGYNNTQAAQMYKERLLRPYSTDYPVLFWMEKLRQDVGRVFDFGGHIGIHFYAYPKVLSFEQIKEWTVCDVEAVCEEGRRYAATQAFKAKLHFVTDILACENYDLFLAKGSLQYLEWELHDKLALLTKKPRYVLVNTTPLHPTLKTITLNNIGTSYCAYYLRLEKDFVEGMKKIGYVMMDSWRTEEKACRIAFEPIRSLGYYTGAIFKLQS